MPRITQIVLPHNNNQQPLPLGENDAQELVALKQPSLIEVIARCIGEFQIKK